MMKCAVITCSLLGCLGVAPRARADVVVLTNGDRISGTLLTVTGSTLNLQTEALGTMTIPISRVATVSVVQIVTMVVRGQPPLRGWLTLSDAGSWDLTEENGETHSIDAAEVNVILPAARYESIVDHQASAWQDWTGTVTAGYSVQRGNQQTNTVSSSVDARRERPLAPIFEPHWRTNVHLTTLLSNAVEAETSIGSDTLSTSVRQDRFFAQGNFVFGIFQFDHVGTEGLSRRETYGGGTGYDLTRGGRGTLSIFAGLTSVHEVFITGGDQQTAQVIVGEKLRFQLTPRARVDQTANAYPNLTVGGQYHFDTNTTLDVKLTNRFSFNTGLIDLYLTNPAPGSRRNNFALTSGIAATF
jgi:putative salt-induced outer membrane protein YdiY